MARIACLSSGFKSACMSLAFLSYLMCTYVQAQTPASPPVAQGNNVAPSTPAATASATTAPGALRPMKEILRDAKTTPGFFTLHQKDDKVWLEILPSQLGKAFLFHLQRFAIDW